MENLENENLSLEFQVQSLIKERENVKLEYQKLFNSIKKTRTQTQDEIYELIEHVNQNTYAYADISAKNQDLLMTITELKTKLKSAEKGVTDVTYVTPTVVTGGEGVSSTSVSYPIATSNVINNDATPTVDTNIGEGLSANDGIHAGSPNIIDTGTILYFTLVSPMSSSLNANKNRGSKGGTEPVNEVPSSYATKLRPTSSTKANLRKIEANIPQDADYDFWLTLALVHEFSSNEGVDSVLRDGPWMIHGIPIFLNKWSPSVSLLKEELSHVPVWVKFHDVSLVAYTSDVLSLMVTKIGTSMMLDSYTNSMCLESRGRSSYARIQIEINACNDFSDNLVMAAPDLKGNGYTKETIRVEYEWKHPPCSTCLIFGHSLDDFPKAPLKRVVNSMEKGKEQSSGADDEGFIEVKKKKSGAFKPVSMKPKTNYRPVAKKSTGGTNNSPRTTPSAGKKNVPTSGNGTFSLSISFEALNADPIIEELMEGKYVLVDDDGKPLEKVDYSDARGSEDEVEYVDNEMASYLASKPSEGGYGAISLLEQWRETYGNEYFFEQLCESYDVVKFIRAHAPDINTSAPTPFTPEELKIDKIMLSWILFTLSDSLRARLVLARPKSAKEAWSLISEIVKDNKRSCTNALKAELRSIKLGDQSMESYFQKIDSIVNILTSLDAHVNDEDVIHYALEGLPETYANVCGYMHWKDTFPDLKTVQSLLLTEEMRLKPKVLSSS
ncbi:hybrid signal transduction histidine kinase M, partial [Tanacetum coccineum]